MNDGHTMRRSGGRADRVARRAANPCPPGQRGGQYGPLSDADMVAIYRTALRLLSDLGVGDRADVVANGGDTDNGSGIPAESTPEAIDIFARQEAILLGPVCSGKGAAGSIDLCRKGHFRSGKRIVFPHTRVFASDRRAAATVHRQPR